MSAVVHPRLHGVLAEFATAEQLIAAARTARAAGYRQMDAYTPFHVEGLAEALELKATRLPWLVLAGGIAGAGLGFFLQFYASAISYPLNVGGCPYVSWPAFVPVTFEVTILCAALAAVLGMLALNGLPRPYHPLFGIPRFDRASRDRFFLCVESTDPQFDVDRIKQMLASTDAAAIDEVPLV